jgi:hypothetical protein
MGRGVEEGWDFVKGNFRVAGMGIVVVGRGFTVFLAGK